MRWHFQLSQGDPHHDAQFEMRTMRDLWVCVCVDRSLGHNKKVVEVIVRRVCDGRSIASPKAVSTPRVTLCLQKN